jgi:HD-GYP domain-containing protein (c-di-GMP phosphodiesterase class II)/pSer/pThr/pTyr-binding forkhead associated (FHA) protein
VATARLVLSSVTLPQRTWSTTNHLRIGRLPDLEVMLDDGSISRRHAEVVLSEEGWIVRDCGSMNGTQLNGVRVGRTPQRVRQGDTINVGNIDLRIEVLQGQPSTIQIGGQRSVQVEATSRRSWDEAVEGFDLTDERWQRDGKAFLQLIRAGYRLAHTTSPDEQFQRLLEEASVFFKAQRAGMFLADTSGKLTIRSVVINKDYPIADRTLCKTPSNRAFHARESVLFKHCMQSAELLTAESVVRGSMASIVCAVLRSPERVLGVLHLDRSFLQEPFSETDLYLADSLAAALALAVERLQMEDRQHELFLQTVTALAQAVEMRDSYTGDHTHRVTAYSLILAEELGLPADQRQLLRAATALHDIGKIGVDDEILRKPGRLSDAEFNHMKRHVTRGSEIIQMIPGLAWALPVVRGHHERWDGTGYPDKLKGEEIPLTARVVSVADAFDAMTSDRPYRRGMPSSVAFAELEAGAGKQFDPRCVEAFIRARPRIEALLKQETTFREQAERETGTVTVQELHRQLAQVDTTDVSVSSILNPGETKSS